MSNQFLTIQMNIIMDIILLNSIILLKNKYPTIIYIYYQYKLSILNITKNFKIFEIMMIIIFKFLKYLFTIFYYLKIILLFIKVNYFHLDNLVLFALLNLFFKYY